MIYWELLIEWLDHTGPIHGKFSSLGDCVRIVDRYNGYYKVTITTGYFEHDDPNKF